MNSATKIVSVGPKAPLLGYLDPQGLATPNLPKPLEIGIYLKNSF